VHRLRHLSFLDRLLLIFLSYMAVRALMAPDGPHATVARVVQGTALGAAVALIAVVRGRQRGGLLWRVGILVLLLVPYLFQRDLLFALGVPPFDEALAALDRRLLGEVPAVALAGHVPAGAVEALAIAYALYYPLLAFSAFPPVLGGSGSVARRVLAGLAVILCVGQVGYTLVPGYGPYRALHFSAPLVGGPWLAGVQGFVAEAGPLLDIFPSLHTALPCFFAWIAWRHRAAGRASGLWLGPLWPLLALLALAIVAATQVLRWHYAVDVVAGAGLAVLAALAGPVVDRWETQRMVRGGMPDLPPLAPRWRAPVCRKRGPKNEPDFTNS